MKYEKVFPHDARLFDPNGGVPRPGKPLTIEMLKKCRASLEETGEPVTGDGLLFIDDDSPEARSTIKELYGE